MFLVILIIVAFKFFPLFRYQTKHVNVGRDLNRVQIMMRIAFRKCTRYAVMALGEIRWATAGMRLDGKTTATIR